MYRHFLKPLMDFLIGIIGTIILLPIFIILGIVIFIDDPGPIFFRQKRVGKNKKLFTIWKLRTMKRKTPDVPTHLLEHPEQYITRVGRVLRKLSLDELPNLFSLVSLRLSLIGPRPALWNQDDLISERDKYGANDVRPGITGWAQINGRDELEIPEKAKLDGEYVKRRSFLFDCKCFFGTIKAVFKHDGVVEGGTGTIHKSDDECDVSTEIYSLTQENEVSEATYIADTDVRLDTERCCDGIYKKRILLFIPRFFSYEKAIEKCYYDCGADVTLYDERAVTSALSRALIKIFPVIFAHKAQKYYRNIINRHKNENVDYILIIRCDMVSKKTLRLFKRSFPKTKLCLHLWDSLSNIKGITKKLPYFDHITSFDRHDCEQREDLHFRPLFCRDEYKKESTELHLDETIEKDIDIFFCGTIHSDRYEIIKSIERQCKRQGLKYKGIHYLQSKFMYSYCKMFKKGFKKSSKDDFCFVAATSEEIFDNLEHSKTVLDIQHPKQIGLTMRTLEMLGMHKKIITTNEDVKNYDFYELGNISVIDRKRPIIDAEFINRPFRDIPTEMWNKYSLRQWATDVLGIATGEEIYEE